METAARTAAREQAQTAPPLLSAKEEDVAAVEIAGKDEAGQITAEKPEEDEEQDLENPDDLRNFAVFGVPLKQDKNLHQQMVTTICSKFLQ
ncbi:hypothetical protein BV898_18234 [Hypsibius exemplaris]|uniref:Uncharacterized protein n=1 Tax=Hypsibius exemplaris TaxID=2072580 RepID=A0A9X6RNA4_HYPEX|nr:hypothetical protein BV898_18234 [Hypsibius exemplaris]